MAGGVAVAEALLVFVTLPVRLLDCVLLALPVADGVLLGEDVTDAVVDTDAVAVFVAEAVTVLVRELVALTVAVFVPVAVKLMDAVFDAVWEWEGVFERVRLELPVGVRDDVPVPLALAVLLDEDDELTEDVLDEVRECVADWEAVFVLAACAVAMSTRRGMLIRMHMLLESYTAD